MDEPTGPGRTGRAVSTMLVGNGQARLRAKRYLLTWSQTGDHELQDWLLELAKLSPKYLLVCKETHQDEGTHFHAVVIFERELNTRNMTYFDVRTYHPNIKTLKTNRDIEQSIAYVKKDGQWLEQGDRPQTVVGIQRAEKIGLIKSSTLKECIDSGLFSLSEISRIPTIKMYLLPNWPTWKKREVYWLYGPTGSGKSRCAIEQMKERYTNDFVMLSGDLKTFLIGYEGQKGVIFDDLRPGSIRFESLLRLLDGYPVTVNVKGSHCPWLAETIYITAPTQPTEMYVYRTETGDTREWDHLDQLLRRIDQVIQYPL